MAMHILFPTWSLSLVIIVGCAVPEHYANEPPAEAVSRSSLSPEEITHRSDYWREEASELHETRLGSDARTKINLLFT